VLDCAKVSIPFAACIKSFIVYLAVWRVCVIFMYMRDAHMYLLCIPVYVYSYLLCVFLMFTRTDVWIALHLLAHTPTSLLNSLFSMTGSHGVFDKLLGGCLRRNGRLGKTIVEFVSEVYKRNGALGVPGSSSGFCVTYDMCICV
jgi:hypothetical protein